MSDRADRRVRLADVFRLLSDVANEECDCGGSEYRKGCKACDVWHAFKARARTLEAPRS